MMPSAIGPTFNRLRLADDVDELEGDLAGAFQSVSSCGSPIVVDRRRHLPRLALHVGGDDVVAGARVVAVGAEPAVDERIRLEVAHELREAVRTIAGHHARRVEPDERDRSVAREQFPDLRLGLASQVLVVVFFLVSAEVPGISRAVRFVPVLRLGVIESGAS
jgi:hypothetical protein